MLDIQGASVLLADGTVADTSVLLDAFRHNPCVGGTGARRRFDARGLFALPGIIDLHGDAFERQMQPRPGVDFPDPARAARHRGAIARQRHHHRDARHHPVLGARPAQRPELAPAGRRARGAPARPWSATCASTCGGSSTTCPRSRWRLADVEAGRVGLVSFNDHMGVHPAGDGQTDRGDSNSASAPDCLCPSYATVGRDDRHWRASDVPASASNAWPRRPAVQGIPMASHDDDTRSPFVSVYRAVGSRICEFPVVEHVGQEARGAGDAVVMGCPNVVRGGSHLGWASAAAPWPSATSAPSSVVIISTRRCCRPRGRWAIAASLSLAQAWALVSANAAAAARLDDRGTIADGKRADIVLVDPAGPTVVATFAAGRAGFIGGAGWDRPALETVNSAGSTPKPPTIPCARNGPSIRSRRLPPDVPITALARIAAPGWAPRRAGPRCAGCARADSSIRRFR